MRDGILCAQVWPLSPQGLQQSSLAVALKQVRIAFPKASAIPAGT